MQTARDKTEKVIKEAEKGSSEPIENITESIDNSPIWPGKEDARKVLENDGTRDEKDTEKEDRDK